MKKTVFIVLIVLTHVSVYAQQSVYYYYGNKKIYLTESSDKVFVKFSSADSNQSIPLSPGIVMDRRISFAVAVVEATTGMNIGKSVFDNLKSNSDVISVTPLLQYNGMSQGLTDEFIVRLKPATSFAELQNLVSKSGCTIVKGNEFVENQYIISIPKTSGLNSMQAANVFYETGLFEFSEPNFVFINALNYDFYGGQQWGLHNDATGVDINIEPAWAITEGSPDIKIALIDDGVDLTHTDLSPNLLPGYDATGNNSGGAWVYLYEYHGTACAGIIGAVKDNGWGIAGVVPGCKIIPIHVTIQEDATVDWFADGIRWAYMYGNADILSNSWGVSSPSANITSAIDDATTFGRNGKGCVVVFASGNANNSTVSYPGCLPNVIAVGAIDRCGYRAGRQGLVPFVCDPWQCPPNTPDCGLDGSNYGIDLDIVAPGSNIYTTDVQGGFGYNENPDNGDYFGGFGGTSAACPHVAGVAALILSVNSFLTEQQVRNIIESTARKLGSYSYQENVPEHPNGSWNEEVGHGLVDAHAAVKLAQIFNPNNPCGITYINNETYYNDPPHYIVKNMIIDCEVEITNTIIEPAAEVEVVASNEIHLLPGFHAQAGSIARMRIAQMEVNNNFSLVRFTSTISKKTEEDDDYIAKNDNISIYPNPVTNWVNIRITNPERVQYIEIRNMQGICLTKLTSVGILEETKINISDLSTGVYYVMVSSVDKLKSFKLIKQ